VDGELELLIDGCGEAQPWVTVPRERVDPVGADPDAIRDGVRRVLAGESVYSITKQWQATVPRCAAASGTRRT